MFGEHAASPANTWGTWFAEVRFPVGNTPPVAFDQETATPVGTLVPIVLLADDLDGDPLTYSVTSLPANGDLFDGATKINAVPHALPGDTVLYIPRGGFSGFDSFDFRASDGQADRNVATVTVRVGNTPPVADSQDVRTDVGVPLAIALTGSDADGDPITFSVTSVPANGDLFEGATKIGPGVPHPLDGQSVLYVPRGGFSGVDEFTFTVNDGKDDSEPAVVKITVVGNTRPVADDQSLATDENTPLAIVLTASDVDGDPLTFKIVERPAPGALFEGATKIVAEDQICHMSSRGTRCCSYRAPRSRDRMCSPSR